MLQKKLVQKFVETPMAGRRGTVMMPAGTVLGKGQPVVIIFIEDY
jgi:hypothetical protein